VSDTPAAKRNESPGPTAVQPKQRGKGADVKARVSPGWTVTASSSRLARLSDLMDAVAAAQLLEADPASGRAKSRKRVKGSRRIAGAGRRNDV
jgi:hypothetical protein